MNLFGNISITYIYAILLGFIPALFWLWFWMHEEHNKSEPKFLILKTFILGGMSVFLVIFFQKAILNFFNLQAELKFVYNYNLLEDKHVNLIFVIIEEFFKFLAAYVIFFRTKDYNEPIDSFVYLMTSALGFAAVENTLYLIQPLFDGENLNVIITTYTRFIGANILHVASSGILSIFIGLSFCKSYIIKEIYIWFGLIFAIIIHWLFNILLIQNNSYYTNKVYIGTWIIALLLLIILEKVKRIKCEI